VLPFGKSKESNLVLITDTTREIAALLIERGETVSVAESSSGGIISAQLLAVPGASRYYRGGSVVYTLPSRREFLDIPRDRVEGLKPLSEEIVAIFAESARLKLDATWGIAELGAAGPTGSRYGHNAGTTVVGIDGPVKMQRLVQTGDDDREQNMMAFSEAALALFLEALKQ
jgi:PncC family amidohydrolase